ncbi:hypothetical protein [Streptomyces sp. NBC_01233]|uniref:hypothetical protein n=1 Tax=Streptomyces sp. NBC_01233 TaxID=2903787 RepID=UPI002E162DDF|nr:hypothetical protein OG332_13115 [Streptomyces sp. NBC_01233]
MSQAGRAVAGHVDLIAECLGRGSAYTGEVLTLALAGMGDSVRCPSCGGWPMPTSYRPTVPAHASWPRCPPRSCSPSCGPSCGATRRTPPSSNSSPSGNPLPRPPCPRWCGSWIRRTPTTPPAAVAAERLAAYGRTHLRLAAWAHWKATGDPTLALAVRGTAVRSGTASHGLPYLADLGPWPPYTRTQCAA